MTFARSWRAVLPEPQQCVASIVNRRSRSLHIDRNRRFLTSKWTSCQPLPPRRRSQTAAGPFRLPWSRSLYLPPSSRRFFPLSFERRQWRRVCEWRRLPSATRLLGANSTRHFRGKSRNVSPIDTNGLPPFRMPPRSLYPRLIHARNGCRPPKVGAGRH